MPSRLEGLFQQGFRDVGCGPKPGEPVELEFLSAGPQEVGRAGHGLVGHYRVVSDLGPSRLLSGSLCYFWLEYLVHRPQACHLAQPGLALLPVTQIAFSLRRALLLIFAFCNHIHSSRQRSKDTLQSGSPSHPLRRQPFFFRALCAFLWQFGKMQLCILFLCRCFEGRQGLPLSHLYNPWPGCVE